MTCRGIHEGGDGPVVVQAWCPRCQTTVLPSERSGSCLWCDGPTEPLTDQDSPRSEDDGGFVKPAPGLLDWMEAAQAKLAES